jgi:hypothetical protein
MMAELPLLAGAASYLSYSKVMRSYCLLLVMDNDGTS